MCTYMYCTAQHTIALFNNSQVKLKTFYCHKLSDITEFKPGTMQDQARNTIKW